MATGRKAPKPSPAPRRKSRKKPERWNDSAPRRGGNPLGLLLIAAGAAGLLYASCGPKQQGSNVVPVKHMTGSAQVVPRSRYVPPAARERQSDQPVQVEEAPAPDDAPKPANERPRHAGRPKADVTETSPTGTEVPTETTTTTETQTPGTEVPSDAQAETPAPVPAPVPAPRPRRVAEQVEPAIRLTPPAVRSGATAARSAAPAIQLPHLPRASSVEFIRNPSAGGLVALSFDGCYDDKPLGKILAALASHGYHATFFIAGRFASRYPGSVRQIADAGMEIGNHSWSHPKFTTLSNTEIDRQLSRTNDLIRKITGRTPTLFRPPFGDRDDRVRSEVADDGFTTVCWAVDSWDSVKKGITPQEISDRVLRRARPGDVVLLHIGSQATADALPGILDALDARGLRVVPVSELIGQ